MIIPPANDAAEIDVKFSPLAKAISKAIKESILWRSSLGDSDDPDYIPGGYYEMILAIEAAVK